MSQINSEPTITRKADAIHTDKADGTRVDYYIFPEYEIHYNEVSPGTVQQWHHHEAIEESVLILRGTLELRWRGSGVIRTRTLQSGDVVRVGRSVHTFVNATEATVTFVVFRLVLDGVDKRQIIKSDKVVDETT